MNRYETFPAARPLVDNKKLYEAKYNIAFYFSLHAKAKKRKKRNTCLHTCEPMSMFLPSGKKAGKKIFLSLYFCSTTRPSDQIRVAFPTQTKRRKRIRNKKRRAESQTGPEREVAEGETKEIWAGRGGDRRIRPPLGLNIPFSQRFSVFLAPPTHSFTSPPPTTCVIAHSIPLFSTCPTPHPNTTPWRSPARGNMIGWKLAAPWPAPPFFTTNIRLHVLTVLRRPTVTRSMPPSPSPFPSPPPSLAPTSGLPTGPGAGVGMERVRVEAEATAGLAIVLVVV